MQTYTDPSRETDPHALPDVEVWDSLYNECPECGNVVLYEQASNVACPECERIFSTTYQLAGWFYWACFPGCLPDSDPIGPFETEAEALADVRDNSRPEESEWSGAPDPADPDNYWIDDVTGERVNAWTGARSLR